METFKRVEIKYILSKEQYEFITSHIKNYMTYGKYGVYNICNIYYDTDDFYLIRKSLEKPIFKEKMRLRSYGVPKDKETVFLEMKRKYNGVVYKRRKEMPFDNAEEFFDKNHLSQISHELMYTKERYDLKPKVFLSYDREEFFDNTDSSFRLTFDKNIFARDYDVDLSKGVYGDRVLPKDKYIMEIKVTNNMPLWFVRILGQAKAYPSSFSKYGTYYKELKNKTTNLEKVSVERRAS